MNHAAIFFRSQISIRRITDEERNQEEGSTEEESRRQEKEVTAAKKTDRPKAPETGPFYLCRPRCTIPMNRWVNS
jgi:hypothetical protein